MTLQKVACELDLGASLAVAGQPNETRRHVQPRGGAWVSSDALLCVPCQPATACLLTPHSLGKSPESPPHNHSTGEIPLTAISACRSTVKPWGFDLTGQCRLDRLQPDPRLLDRTRAGNVKDNFDCRSNATMRLWQAAQETHSRV